MNPPQREAVRYLDGPCLVIAGAGYGWISSIVGFLAIVFAMMNVVGGYAVTDRMLQMFRRRGEDAK